MIYLRLFNNHSEYTEYVASDDFITPNVSGCLQESEAHFNMVKPKSNYLKFTALEDATFSFAGNDLSYSLDEGETWTTLANGVSTPTVASGGSIMWKASLSGNTSAGTFSSTGNYNVEGNPMSLLYGDDFMEKTRIGMQNFYMLFADDTHIISASGMSLPATNLESKNNYAAMFSGCTNLVSAPSSLPATGLSDACYSQMFKGCTNLTTIPSVLPATELFKECYREMFQDCPNITIPPQLPATVMTNYCYRAMFYNCSSLTTVPALPATTLADSCYKSMFKGCTSLTTTPSLPATALTNNCYNAMFRDTNILSTPSLPATSLGSNCYQEMFRNCKGLTTAPALPATTLTTECYYNMFRDCSNIITAPALPATTLANGCYREMFRACVSLTTAPELSATTLVDNCYWGMFNDCTNLNSITCLATDISATDCTNNWVYRVSSSGTFTKPSTMTSWTSGNNGIPTNWTVAPYDVTHVTGVTLNVVSTGITKGDTYQLTATVSPNDAYDKSVTWSTSDGTVATVSNNGLITAVGCGSATITVTTTDGGYTAQCATSVINPVTGISLNTNVLTILTGSTYQLEATLTPSDACGDKSVSWSSSNSNIASVSNNGLVSAVAVGSATITATTTVGSHTATCAVEVTVPVAVTGVSLDESTLALNAGQTRALTATVLPSNAADKAVTWSSNDTSIATVTSEGVVSGVTSGTTDIIVTTHDGGYTASCEVTVSIPVATTLTIGGPANISAETCTYNAIVDNSEDVTSSATWSITSGSQYATINSSNGTVTILTGASESSVTIQAVYASLTASTAVTLTYVSGATSETETESTTDASGNTTTVTTTVVEYEDGSSVEVAESVVTDSNGDVIGSTSSSSMTNADGSYNGNTTNYNANGDPTDATNVTGDTAGNVSTQDVIYDASGNSVVTGYEIDTSETTGKTFNGDGANTDYYAFDVTHGFELEMHFTVDSSNSPAGQNQDHHNILTAKRTTPGPWYGFQLRQTRNDKYIQLGTQFSTGNNTNTTIQPASITGDTAEYNLKIVYDPTLTANTFVCRDLVNSTDVFVSDGIFPDIEALRYLKVLIGYAVDGYNKPYRYANINVLNFSLKRFTRVSAPTIYCDGEEVTISCETVGADIYYRLNESGSYSAYTTAITITADTIVQAYAEKEGFSSSTVTQTCIYTDTVSEPVITCQNNTVEITCGTQGATIHYRLNESGSYSAYTASFTITADTVVEAYATLGNKTSTTASESCTYVVDYSKTYFTIESLQDSNTITVIKGGASVTLSYSLDNGTTWSSQTLSGTTTIGTINTGEKIIFKASTHNWATAWNAYDRFNGSKNFKVYGNAMSLLNDDDFINNSEFAAGSSFNLCGLFYGTTTVIDASNLVLPATTLKISSYNGMFRGCTNLVNAPKLLPALVVPQDAYSSFFEGCVKLEETPIISATTVSGATALNRMFCANRNGKTDTPLTKGPVLHITNPSAYSNVYQQLFAGHQNLNEVTIYAEGTNLSFANWLANTASSGVIKKKSTTTLTSGNNGIPSGWSTQDID